MKEKGALIDSLIFSSRYSKWLDDERLIHLGDWKRQYKLRHNWSRGICNVSEIQVTTTEPTPRLLGQLHEGIVVTADSVYGLRAWSIADHRELIAAIKFSSEPPSETHATPTSLAIDRDNKDEIASFGIVVGFSDGCFSIYALASNLAEFRHCYTYSPQDNTEVTAIAFSWPYVITMTDSRLLSLYHFDASWSIKGTFGPPRLTCSLGSHTVWPPLCLSLRSTSHSVIVSVAYSVPTYLSGWSVSVQELHLTEDGKVAISRLASAVKQGFNPLSPNLSALAAPALVSDDSPGESLNGSSSKPTSVAYTHPYLLTCHADNTMSLYLVKSSNDEFSISSGSRLWGHTSSVSGAFVGSRGKAVSVSSRGDELRLWELESAINGVKSRRTMVTGDSGVQVRPKRGTSVQTPATDTEPQSHPSQGTGMFRQLDGDGRTDRLSSEWIGFDEEKVVLLKQKTPGNQALVIYDFS